MNRRSFPGFQDMGDCDGVLTDCGSPPDAYTHGTTPRCDHMARSPGTGPRYLSREDIEEQHAGSKG